MSKLINYNHNYMNVEKYVKILTPFTSNIDFRPAIKTVAHDEKNNLMVATDSYHLIEVKSKDNARTLLSDETKYYTVRDKSKQTDDTIEYPEYQGIIPKIDDEKTIKINSAFLLNVAKALKALKVKDVYIQTSDNRSHILFTGTNKESEEVTALIMSIIK